MEQLFAIKKTQLEMMRDRGFNIDEEQNILNMSIDNFVQYITGLAGQQMSRIRYTLSHFYQTAPDATGRRKTILVYYGTKDAGTAGVGVGVIRPYLDLLRQAPVNESILIINAPIASLANQELATFIRTSGIKVQIFFDADLGYNPTQHIDTPR